MPGAGKKQNHKKFRNSLHIRNRTKKSHTRKPKLKQKFDGNTIGSMMLKEKATGHVSKGKSIKSTRRNIINKATLCKSKSSKKQASLSLQNKIGSVIGSNENDDGIFKSQKLKKRGRRKRTRDNVELDEASRLQRRTRYLLVKMKLEQNLIDAYSMEGWKGQSREKIKPEKELQRAKKQILKCKLGIRDAIHQLDLLSSVGQIAGSAIAPDGSVYHENIFCAKCKLREASPDNDIILCDGTCNCAFHQKCLDPPLSTENRDQGWLCKFCDCKMEILEGMNAHLGTHFSADSNWQDIFKEEAALPDGGDALLYREQEWPSDDSEDDDYDPENFENSSSYSKVGSEDYASDDASGSSSIWSLEAEVFSGSERLNKRSNDSHDTSAELIIGDDSDETSDCEILCGRRQRRAVDYKKLYDEMFGKDVPANEQFSEDEDWGPTKRKRREKESDAASTLMTLCENDDKCPHLENTEAEKKPPGKKTKRPFFRIPPSAVEKLRLVFAENELPSRAVRETLSKQLGLESEKVNKWFKNARYLALKAKKAGRAKPFQTFDPKMSKNSKSNIGKDNPADCIASKDLSSENVVMTHKKYKIFQIRKNMPMLASRLKRKHYKKALRQSPANIKAAVDFGDDVTLKLIREKAKKEKRVINCKTGGSVQEAEAEMERLCKIKCKVEKLQQILLALPNHLSNKGDAPSLNEMSLIYVPVAVMKEKR